MKFKFSFFFSFYFDLTCAVNEAEPEVRCAIMFRRPAFMQKQNIHQNGVIHFRSRLHVHAHFFFLFFILVRTIAAYVVFSKATCVVIFLYSKRGAFWRYHQWMTPHQLILVVKLLFFYIYILFHFFFLLLRFCFNQQFT